MSRQDYKPQEVERVERHRWTKGRVSVTCGSNNTQRFDGRGSGGGRVERESSLTRKMLGQVWRSKGGRF